MPLITVDARTFLKGASISDELSDGGFSPLSKGINLFAKPGLILPGPAAADQAGASLATGGIIAWSTVVSNIAPGITRGLGTNGAFDGLFYQFSDAGSATAVPAATDTTRDYKPVISDMTRYGVSNEFFVTSTNNVAKLSSDFLTQDFTWWTVTRGHAALGTNNPHKIIQFGLIMYITDGRYLHSWDGTTSTVQVFKLPENYVIQDAVVYDNKIYLAACICDSQGPYGGGSVLSPRLFTWDGFSASFTDELPVPEVVDSLIVFGGTLFITTRSYIGYWTGATVNPLYPLTSSVFKHQYTVTLDRLYLVQGQDLLCYGNPAISHAKFFSFPIHHSSSLISIVSNKRGQIIYSYVSVTGAWTDVNASTQVGQSFYSNKVFFGQRGDVNHFVVESEPLVSSSDIGLQFVNSKGIWTSMPLSGYTFTARGAVAFFDFPIMGLDVTLLTQVRIIFNAAPVGIRRVQVVYGYSEFKGN